MGIASLHPSYGSAALGHWPTTPAILRPHSRPPRDPNGLRNVQLSTLFSALYCQNRLETLRTSDVGTIDRR